MQMERASWMEIRNDRQKGLSYTEIARKYNIDPRTAKKYLLMQRIRPAIGHIKLADLRPQHLNAFYKNLSEAGIRSGEDKAEQRIDLQAYLKRCKMSKAALATAAGVSASTITSVCQGNRINAKKANQIAAALGKKTGDLFRIEKNTEPLANKTILEYHRLIRSILAQADKEMLVPYNTAVKATPPKVTRCEVNYFQPEEITAILDALEQEPIKWQTIIHLLIVTGCRRGEIMGLKWEKVDLKNRKLRIDTALLYSQHGGIYETTTKTGNQRLLTIPQETVDLLRQYKAWQTEQRMANGDRWKETGYLFTKDDGSACDPDTITAWLNSFSKRHGLPHINPHAFRHTVASVLIANGTDVVTVSKQLGHANVSTTEGFYSHIIGENKEKAADCIANVMLRRRA